MFNYRYRLLLLFLDIVILIIFAIDIKMYVVIGKEESKNVKSSFMSKNAY